MRIGIAAAVAAYFLFFFQLTGMGMVGPDEPRYAWIGRAMARSGDWVTPRLWGEPWFEKPALLYWMTAGAFRAGLGDDWAPRLPVAVLSVVFLIFFYRQMKAEFGGAAAGYGTAVLATSAGWVAYSRVAVTDLPLSATFGAAMLSLLGWIERREKRGLLPFAALLGLAVLAKGLVGPVLAVLVLLCWAARMGGRQLKDLARPGLVITFLAAAAPWYALCYARNGGVFLEEFFWRHHFARYAAGALEHNQPVWFFLPVLAGLLLPWTPLLLLLGRDALWKDRRFFFLAWWAAVTLVFFSFSKDKLPGYILAALPALAALAGIMLAREKSARAVLPLCAAMLALMPAAAAVLPAALGAGLGEALAQVKFPLLPLAGVVLVTAFVWAAERAGSRQAAAAAIAVAAVTGYALIMHYTLAPIDRQAGARTLWQQAGIHDGSICLGQVRRHVAYGLNYYAGRPLPGCTDEPKPFRIEDGEVLANPRF